MVLSIALGASTTHKIEAEKEKSETKRFSLEPLIFMFRYDLRCLDRYVTGGRQEGDHQE